MVLLGKTRQRESLKPAGTVGILHRLLLFLSYVHICCTFCWFLWLHIRHSRRYLGSEPFVKRNQLLFSISFLFFHTLLTVWTCELNCGGYSGHVSLNQHFEKHQRAPSDHASLCFPLPTNKNEPLLKLGMYFSVNSVLHSKLSSNWVNTKWF